MDNQESLVGAPEDHLLTRSQAARYVGVSGESAIRAAEAKGLRGTADPSGQVWLTPEALDAWTWRVKTPPPAQRARVLRDARKARQQEARGRERKEEQDAQRELAEWEASQARLRAEWNAEDALRAGVKRKAEEMRAAFTPVHMDAYTAEQALGFKSYEAGRKLRQLVQCGLLRQFQSPLEPMVRMSIDGLREVEGSVPLCLGGPFYLREEVLALRREAIEVARESLAKAPEPVRVEAAATPPKDVVAELLRFVIDNLPKR
jgi:hypothetical protein